MSDQFHTLAVAVNKQLTEMSKDELFVVNGIDIFTSYLLSFPEGTDPIFRTNTVHDCSCCKNFIRNMGSLVSIKNGKKISVWQNNENLPHPYNVVAKAMDDLVQQLPIKTVFRTKESGYGSSHTYDIEGRRWNHFWGQTESRHRSRDAATARGSIETTAAVLKRGLIELKSSALETVLDLIDSNSLYRGAEFRKSVKEFVDLQRAFNTASDPDLHVWANVGNPAARFRNTVIGTLVQDISDGVDIERAVRSFEAKVAPTNYKRTTALITPKMIDQALTKLRELDLESSIERRFARLNDVSVNDVLFVDNSVREIMKDNLRSSLMEATKPLPHKTSNKVTDISITDFVNSVLPKAKNIELMLKNEHLSNFMSITAPVHADSGKLFKWNNNFAWSYDGEVADSIKQRVKKAGGNTNAALRVSLAWSNYDDLDIHAHCPDGHIFYGDKRRILDVDMNAGGGSSRTPVENLSWTTPRNGEYVISVNQFHKRETRDEGFTMEIECNGNIQQFNYPLAVKSNIKCLSFTMRNGVMENLKILNAKLCGGDMSTEKWGVNTETMVPVSTLLNSPNHWENAGGVGNKHWFFILKDCKNPDATRGIYNEFLRGDLEPHRKVFEVLGTKTKCEMTDSQMSGVGFTSGRDNKVTVQVTSNDSTRLYNINF